MYYAKDHDGASKNFYKVDSLSLLYYHALHYLCLEAVFSQFGNELIPSWAQGVRENYLETCY